MKLRWLLAIALGIGCSERASPPPAPSIPVTPTPVLLPPAPTPAPERLETTAVARVGTLRVLVDHPEDPFAPWGRATPMEVCRIGGATVWSDSAGRLYRLGANGHSTPIEALGHVMNIVCDDEAVYYGDDHALVRVPVEGAPSIVARIDEDPLHLAIDGDDAWFGAFQRRDVWRVSKRGGTAVRTAIGTREPGNVATDAEFVYWTEYGSGLVQRMPKRGGPVRAIARGQAHPIALAVSEDHVYWGTETDGGVHRIAKSGGRIEHLASGQENHDQFAIHGGHLYWGSWLGGLGSHTFARIPLEGGAVEILIERLSMPEAFVLDDGRLYLVNKGDGEILELTLP